LPQIDGSDPPPFEPDELDELDTAANAFGVGTADAAGPNIPPPSSSHH